MSPDLNQYEVTELADLLAISQKAKAREALCIKIGISYYKELGFIYESSDSSFAINLINHLNEVGNTKAICQLCCKELSPIFQGTRKSFLKEIAIKLNCNQEFRHNYQNTTIVEQPTFPLHSPVPDFVINPPSATPPTSNKRPISATPPTSNKRPRTIGQQKNITQSYNLTASSAIELGKKIWFIFLPIVILWFFVGSIHSQIEIKITETSKILLISGSLGGFFSGLGGGLAWWRVASRSVQWEQALLSSVIGLIGGAIGWTIVGTILDKTNNLVNHGNVVGLFFGLIVVGVIFWRLSLISSRA